MKWMKWHMQVSAFTEVLAGPDLEILYFINQVALFSLDITCFKYHSLEFKSSFKHVEKSIFSSQVPQCIVRRGGSERWRRKTDSESHFKGFRLH